MDSAMDTSPSTSAPTNSHAPLPLFRRLFEQAAATDMDYPDAVALTTVGSGGRPSTRTVLLKQFDEAGFVFYTNLGSRKAREIEDNPQVCLHFYWRELGRQVLIEGRAEPVSDQQADDYFASRARTSRLGAWASRQSQPMSGRGQLLKEVARYEARFLAGPVPRPPFWSGFRVVPDRYEFWKEGAFRLHERLRFDKAAEGWRQVRLFP